MPIQLPIGKEADFKGIIDLVEMDADIYYDEMGKDMRVEPIPEDMMDLANEYREKLIGCGFHVRRGHHGEISRRRRDILRIRSVQPSARLPLRCTK